MMGKPARFMKPVTKAEARIALRWFRSEIGTADAGRLLGELDPDGSSLVYRLARAIRQAVALGLIEIHEPKKL